MNQPDNRPVGVPGGVPRPAPRSASGRPVHETDGLLDSVDDDLLSIDDHDPQDQVAVFDRIHTTLADALARTADTGGAPAGGQQGA